MTAISTTSKVGAFSLIRFIFKHYYVLLIVISIIPSIIISINIARETNNPSYPFVDLGMTLINADSKIYEKVQVLEENPSEVIGMEKPEFGIWNNVKYYWKIFLVYWNILGLVFIITLPFSITYKILRLKNTSEVGKNILLTLIIGLFFIFLVNLMVTIYGFAEGNNIYKFEESWDFYKKIGYIIYINIPFHGLISLGKYLINLF